MGKSGKQNRKKRIGYNGLGMFGIILIVLVLLSFLMVEAHGLRGTIAAYDARAEALTQEIAQEEERTKEIGELKEYMLTDEYAEQAAREKLGLIRENEILFKEEE